MPCGVTGEKPPSIRVFTLAAAATAPFAGAVRPWRRASCRSATLRSRPARHARASCRTGSHRRRRPLSRECKLCSRPSRAPSTRHALRRRLPSARCVQADGAGRADQPGPSRAGRGGDAQAAHQMPGERACAVLGRGAAAGVPEQPRHPYHPSLPRTTPASLATLARPTTATRDAPRRTPRAHPALALHPHAPPCLHPACTLPAAAPAPRLHPALRLHPACALPAPAQAHRSSLTGLRTELPEEVRVRVRARARARVRVRVRVRVRARWSRPSCS